MLQNKRFIKCKNRERLDRLVKTIIKMNKKVAIVKEQEINTNIHISKVDIVIIV